ncbi:MAG: DUF2442 domain-containing protein [Halothece sp.]
MANQLESDQTLLAKIEQARQVTEQDKTPRAIHASYDKTSRKIIIYFNNGAEFAFPATLGEGLQNATCSQLAEVEVTPLGEGLHWESLDVDLSIPHLLNQLLVTSDQ